MSILDRIQKIIENETGIEAEVTMESTFEDLELDSLDLVELTVACEDEFEIEVKAVPQYDVNNPKMISQGPSICIFNKRDPQEVLASWIFAQYLLTNDVQIAYSETEGYSPVTLKAQNSTEYQDYLSRAGEVVDGDNKKYYKVKIDATKLVMDNTDYTFITPVFPGSTSLRNAAGELIEKVSKSARRGEELDDKYFDKLFNDVKSLYRLDEIKPKVEN